MGKLTFLEIVIILAFAAWFFGFQPWYFPFIGTLIMTATVIILAIFPKRALPSDE